MLKLCVIGAGAHSQGQHLPALAACAARHPGIALAAICDLDAARAREAAARFGFARAFADPAAMLADIRPDAALVIAPVETTSDISLRLLRDGIPVLVEKPLGATIETARAFAAATAACPAPAMVSMNRRFDPMTAAALAWIGPRRVTKIHAVMRRRRRTEPDFLTATGLHIVDAVLAAAGASAGAADAAGVGAAGTAAAGAAGTRCDSSAEWRDGAWWWTLRMAFPDGTAAAIEIQPTHGRDEEWLRFSGDGFQAEARNAEFDAGRWQAWSAGLPAVAGDTAVAGPPVAGGDTAGMAPFEANGTAAETAAFIEAVLARRPPRPTPAEVLPGMELCFSAQKNHLAQAPAPVGRGRAHR